MPVIAEKKWIFTESEIEVYEKDTTVAGFYSGAILTACWAQLDGYINEEQKIALIEKARRQLYRKHSKPKEIETYFMKQTNKAFKSFACMPKTKP